MYKRKFISACVAMALNNPVFAAPAGNTSQLSAAETCPADIDELTEEQKAKLPASCLEDNNMKAWVLGGAAAVAAAVGIAVAVSNDDSGSDSSNASSGGGDGSGGDGSGGDSSGGDGNSGDGSSGDGSGGDSSGGDGNSGDGSGKTGTTTYSNGAVLNRDAGTLTIAAVNAGENAYSDVTFTYQQTDGGWRLTAEDGRTLSVTDWQVTGDNALTLFGTQGEADQGWIFDRAGKFTWGEADSLNSTGDGASTTIDSGIDVAQQDQAGVLIFGNGTTTQINGNTNVSNGGTGIKVEGDDAAITFNNGSVITVDGTGSAGADISGDRARVQAGGDLYVSDGATGIAIKGADAQLSNSGNITVVDNGSVGVLLAGDNAVFSNQGAINASLNGTGVSVTGDNAQVDLNGTLTVNYAQDSDGKMQGATGLNLVGNHAQVKIAGDVSMGAALTSTGADNLALTGVSVTGNDNAVDITGSVTLTSSNVATATANTATGLSVSGENNKITIAGGVNIDFTRTSTQNDPNATGISVSGNNQVNIGGESTLIMKNAINGDFAVLANITDGGHLVLNTDSRLNISSSGSRGIVHQAVVIANGTGSTIDNYGTINSDSFDTTLLQAASGAVVTNHGTITSKASANTGSWGIVESYSGSTAVNASDGSINLTNSYTPSGGTMLSDLPVRGYTRTGYAMLSGLSSTASTLLNEGEINLQGAGLFGMGLTKGTATNAGTINLDGFVPTFDDEGNITEKRIWAGNILTHGAGIVTGSSAVATANASATNTGTINVNNEGFGMLALSGGTVTNQGTINLTADEGVERTTDNQLVGIGVFGGTAINDQTGVINILSDAGQAFYNNGTGTIVNYGQVCVGTACQDAATYNPTDGNVNLRFTDGSQLAAEGETVTLPTSSSAMLSGNVSNAGIINAGKLNLTAGATLTNAQTGTLAASLTNNGGTLNNAGTISGALAQGSGITNNQGTLSGAVTVNGGTLDNGGTITSRAVVNNKGIINNTASMNAGAKLTGNATLNNTGTVTLGSSAKNAGMLEVSNTATFNNNGALTLNSNKNAVHINNGGTLNNNGEFNATASSHSGTVNFYGNTTGMFRNSGTVNVSGVSSVAASLANAGGNNAFFWNDAGGTVNFNQANGKAVNFSHSNYAAQNDGTLNVSGNKAVAMYGDYNSQLVNNGTINLGTTGTTDTGLIGMQLGANATESAVIENNGAININANDSYAFSNLGAGHVVNNGTVTFADGVTGAGLIAQSDKTVEGVNGNADDKSETHYASYTLPGTASGTNSLQGYVVGTNANGSAGKLMVSNASMQGVSVNTGFTNGTDATSVTFNDVVQGSNLSDAGAIQSTSVVWNAKGSTDAAGNVDVTMTKNAYADAAGDSSVASIAGALDAAYTNNALFNSLNVGTSAELSSALKQISGAGAASAGRDARVLSNRFSMLADSAPQMPNGLSFNVVAKGDQRAELSNNTKYDMMALGQKFALGGNQTLSVQYGMARLDGNGARSAGDNGLTGGYSQFLGFDHALPLGDDGLMLNNSLRYDIHNLDTRRSISYGDVNATAKSGNREQYLELRSTAGKTLQLQEGLDVTPYAGLKLRHTLSDGYGERGAGDFNLKMSNGSETAVDSVTGVKLNYAGKNGWAVTASLEGGPNLSYAQSQRKASLQGAAGQSFNVNSGEKGGGFNGQATLGVKYSGKEGALQLDAFQWKEDGISDKGLMFNLKKTF